MRGHKVGEKDWQRNALVELEKYKEHFRLGINSRLSLELGMTWQQLEYIDKFIIEVMTERVNAGENVDDFFVRDLTVTGFIVGLAISKKLFQVGWEIIPLPPTEDKGRIN